MQQQGRTQIEPHCISEKDHTAGQMEHDMITQYRWKCAYRDLIDIRQSGCDRQLHERVIGLANTFSFAVFIVLASLGAPPAVTFFSFGANRMAHNYFTQGQRHRSR